MRFYTKRHQFYCGIDLHASYHVVIKKSAPNRDYDIISETIIKGRLTMPNTIICGMDAHDNTLSGAISNCGDMADHAAF